MTQPRKPIEGIDFTVETSEDKDLQAAVNLAQHRLDGKRLTVEQQEKVCKALIAMWFAATN